MQTALVILLLLALCGFIAYIGDLLGRRLGKKRLSIFGLRPKHTAIVLTIVTGVLIAAVTFGSALLVVPGFRRTVMEGERLAGANSRLRREVRNLDSQRTTLSSQIEQLATKNGELSQQNAALSGESARLTTANQALAKKNSGLAAANSRLEKESAGLERRNKDLTSANNGLRGSNHRLQASNTELAQSNRRIQAEVQRVAAQRQKAVLERDRARREVTALRQETEDLKDGENIVRKQQQITFLPIPPNPPIEQIRTAVSNLLYEARHPKGQPETRLLELKPSDNYNGLENDEKSFKEWIVQQMATAKNQRLVVRLVATENAVKGRPIQAKLDWYANKLAFSRGEEIIATRMDGAGSLGTILEQLVAFLRSDIGVVGAAKQKRMMNRGEEGFVGEMTADQILTVCEEIRSQAGMVRVVARARQDTYMSGPLNLDLEVRPIGSSETTRR